MRGRPRPEKGWVYRHRAEVPSHAPARSGNRVDRAGDSVAGGGENTMKRAFAMALAVAIASAVLPAENDPSPLAGRPPSEGCVRPEMRVAEDHRLAGAAGIREWPTNLRTDLRGTAITAVFPENELDRPWND